MAVLVFDSCTQKPRLASLGARVGYKPCLSPLSETQT